MKSIKEIIMDTLGITGVAYGLNVVTHPLLKPTNDSYIENMSNYGTSETVLYYTAALAITLPIAMLAKEWYKSRS